MVNPIIIFFAAAGSFFGGWKAKDYIESPFEKVKPRIPDPSSSRFVLVSERNPSLLQCENYPQSLSFRFYSSLKAKLETEIRRLEEPPPSNLKEDKNFLQNLEKHRSWNQKRAKARFDRLNHSLTVSRGKLSVTFPAISDLKQEFVQLHSSHYEFYRKMVPELLQRAQDRLESVFGPTIISDLQKPVIVKMHDVTGIGRGNALPPFPWEDHLTVHGFLDQMTAPTPLLDHYRYRELENFLVHEIAHSILWERRGWLKGPFQIPPWLYEGLATFADQHAEEHLRLAPFLNVNDFGLDKFNRTFPFSLKGEASRLIGNLQSGVSDYLEFYLAAKYLLRESGLKSDAAPHLYDRLKNGESLETILSQVSNDRWTTEEDFLRDVKEEYLPELVADTREFHEMLGDHFEQDVTPLRGIIMKTNSLDHIYDPLQREGLQKVYAPIFRSETLFNLSLQDCENLENRLRAYLNHYSDPIYADVARFLLGCLAFSQQNFVAAIQHLEAARRQMYERSLTFSISLAEANLLALLADAYILIGEEDVGYELLTSLAPQSQSGEKLDRYFEKSGWGEIWSRVQLLKQNPSALRQFLEVTVTSGDYRLLNLQDWPKQPYY